MSSRPLANTADHPGLYIVDGVIVQETWGGKFMRKFKENPFVPIGTAATVVALVMSFIKMRRGESLKMNYWMRARVAFQAGTVGALAIGAYALGQTKQQKEARAQAENDSALERAAQERAEFHERLKAAEEAQRVEDEMNGKSSRWIGMFGSGKGAAGGAQARQAAEAQKLPTPSEVTSAPAGAADVHAPATQDTLSSAPAGADKVRTPVADAPGKSSGWWSWLGGSGKGS